MTGPSLRKRSAWQKPDCLFCSNAATLEAYAATGNRSATIRCCSEKKCQERALSLAKNWIEEFEPVKKEIN